MPVRTINPSPPSHTVTTGAIVVSGPGGVPGGEPAEMAYTGYGHPCAPIHLLAVHGLFDDQATWAQLLPHLQQDLYVVTIDLLGSGRSSCPRLDHLPEDERYSADYHVHSLRQVIAALGLRDLVLLGSSFGGGIILRMLCTPWPERPSMRGLILEDAAGFPAQLPPQMQQLIQWPGQLLLYSPIRRLLRVTGWARGRVLQSVHRAFHDPGKIPANLPTRHLQILRSRAAVRACRETVRNMVPSDMSETVEAYGRLETPTLVLWGRQDRILSPLYGQRFVDELPRAQLHLFDDCGHAPHLEQPEQMARIIHDWLQDTVPDGDDRA